MLGHRALNVEDYLTILKRRGWIVLIPLILLPIISTAYSYTLAPQYLSQTLVLVEGQKVPDNLVKPVISSDLDSRLASMKEQILSRSSLQPIIERYNLYPEKKYTLDDRIDFARKNIDIKTIAAEGAHSGLPGFFISFKAGEARTAQLVCSDITTLFTGENQKAREEATQGTTDFIKSQLADSKRNLDDQDAKLAEFQRQFMGRLPDETSPNVNMLTSLNTQLEAATQALARMEQDKAYTQSLLAQAQSSEPLPSAPSSSGTSPSVALERAQAALQALQTQRTELLSHYTADYPDVVSIDRRIAELRTQIAHTAAIPAPPVTAPSSVASRYDSPAVQQLRAQLRSAELGIQSKRQEQAEIQTNVRMYQDRIQSSPIVEQQYKEVTRDHETAQAFYNTLLSKMNDANMATDLEKRQQGEQFRVMDAANLPDSPFSPKRSVFLMGGLFGGLVLGVVIVAFLEYKDTALRTERDVWAFTQLPTLAVIAYSGELNMKSSNGLFKRKKSQDLAPADH